MYATKRGGFAMILAIFIVVLVALGGVMLLSKAGLGSKFIGDNYLRAQAELLAQSATEFAVMRAQGFNTNSNADCLDQLNIIVNDANNKPMYDINISFAYSFRGAENGSCTNVLEQNTNKDTMMLLDTTVMTRTDANLSTEPIRVFKRSWQKL